MKIMVIASTVPDICRCAQYQRVQKKLLFLVNSLHIVDNCIQSIMLKFKLIDWNICSTLPVSGLHTYALDKAHKIKKSQNKTIWKKVQNVLITNNSFKKYIRYSKIDINECLNLLEGGTLHG